MRTAHVPTAHVRTTHMRTAPARAGGEPVSDPANSTRRSGPLRLRRLAVAIALPGLLAVAGCDTGPGGTVDPDVVNGEEPDVDDDGGIGTTEDSP